jgi:hypothetical protein
MSCVTLSTSPEGSGEQWEFSWEGVADAWLLVATDPLTMPRPSASFALHGRSESGGSQQQASDKEASGGSSFSLFDEFAADLSKKKMRLSTS